MVSTDTKSWDTRSALPLTSFAVDPGNGDRLFGAGPSGLLESRDGGRTWTATPGPPIAVLSWDAGAGLVGITEDGAVHHSPDAGATWSPAGQLPGSPQAVLATVNAWYAAAADEGSTTGIYRSDDAGRNWELHYRDPP